MKGEKKLVACSMAAVLCVSESSLILSPLPVQVQARTVCASEPVNEPVHIHTDLEPDDVQEGSVIVATQSARPLIMMQ